MKSFMKEFKEFALRGSVLDLAIGMIIGAAFTAIITSLVNDIISPLLGLLVGVNFNGLTAKVGGVDIMYGAFIMAIINFFLVALALFFLLKGANKLMSSVKKPEEEAPPETKVCPFCKSEIPIEATRCPHCTSELAAE